ncbi:DUF397 domain-containing protein [Streptomyces sp. BRA346]|uniref:DUF397 domain-containing protein n=1 Tax=Streptomyces sp. BRA346 TaxID=2878199 RepID=UPI0040635BF8
MTRLRGLNGAQWRKSTYSNGMENCVEVADGPLGSVPVRDSKNLNGPVLVFPKSSWSSFTSAVKHGNFTSG